MNQAEILVLIVSWFALGFGLGAMFHQWFDKTFRSLREGCGAQSEAEQQGVQLCKKQE